MRNLILLVALGAVGLPAQDSHSYYLAFKQTTLAGATDALTVQLPTTGVNKDAKFVYASIYCSATCTPSIAQNGTNATTTTLATVALNGAPPSQALAFSASNVGAGSSSVTYPPFPVGISNIDISKYLLTKGANSNLTISLASFTGTWWVLIQWSEQ